MLVYHFGRNKQITVDFRMLLIVAAPNYDPKFRLFSFLFCGTVNQGFNPIGNLTSVVCKRHNQKEQAKISIYRK